MDYFIPKPGTNAPSFRSSTLLLPQPSLSSLAQLACDLLVHTYGLELVGYLGLRDHVPAVGGRDGLRGEEEKEGVALGVEVYTTPSRSLTLVLPRSPVIRARRPHYLDSIKRWIVKCGFKEVLVVAGTDAGMRGDSGLNAITPLRHILPPSGSSSPLSTALRSISPSYLDSSPSGITSSLESFPNSSRIPPIPHGGLTRSLLLTLRESSSLPPTNALLIYTSEGDASSAAHLLADALAYVLAPELAELESRVERVPVQAGEEGQGGDKGRVRWKEPTSWEGGLLGPALTREARGEMFG
ncbi:hypothetical protein JCM10296v2_006065 [Rhodotorula toruloides]